MAEELGTRDVVEQLDKRLSNLEQGQGDLRTEIVGRVDPLWGEMKARFWQVDSRLGRLNAAMGPVRGASRALSTTTTWVARATQVCGRPPSPQGMRMLPGNSAWRAAVVRGTTRTVLERLRLVPSRCAMTTGRRERRTLGLVADAVEDVLRQSDSDPGATGSRDPRTARARAGAS